MARIVYVTANFERPAGGIRTLFRHVEMLCGAGIDAAVSHPSGRHPGWFASAAPVIAEPGDGDILVLPEVATGLMKALAGRPGRRLVFCQNHMMIFPGLEGVGGWRELGITSAFACSPTAARIVAALFGYDAVPVVRCGIDAALFRPAPKRLQVAVMPRKRPGDVALIRHYLVRLFPHHAAVPWLAADNADETEVARLLGQSAVFLSLSRREGFGMPPVEAMAAGCVVAGFAGGGGLDYATPANGLWAAEDDPVDCALKLGQALDLAAAGRAGPLIAGGHATAGLYSLDNMRADLLAFWRGILSDA